MEENDLTSTDFYSMANAVYQAIDKSPTQTMNFEVIRPHVKTKKIIKNTNSDVDGEGETVYHNEDEIMQAMDAYSKSSNDFDNHFLKNHKNNTDDLEDYDEDDVVVAEIEADLEEEIEADKSKINSLVIDTHHILHEDTLKIPYSQQQRPGKPDSITFQNEDGMIKKITITNSKVSTSTPENLVTTNARIIKVKEPIPPPSSPENLLNMNTRIIKVKEPIPPPSSLDDKTLKQQRSIFSPFCREYIALQKSVSESKILTEFVTDASVIKSRKLRKKRLTTAHDPDIVTTTTPTSDHSYSTTAVADNKKRLPRNKRFVALKDETKLASASAMTHSGLGRYSRSRSMHSNFSENSHTTEAREHKKRSKSIHNKYDSDTSTHSAWNKWPSDEDLNNGTKSTKIKRTNMRSENSEFVQKQKEFLQQIKISTQDTPHRRSRSASVAVETLSHSHNGLNSSEQLKNLKSKEKVTKRLNGEFEPTEEDEQTLLTNTNETFDDVSVNTSINSLSGINTSGEVDNNVVDSVELFIKNVWQLPPKSGSDSFCWKCHGSKVNLACSKCIRSYHTVCAKAKVDTIWICPECATLENILNSPPKRSRRNELPLELLSQLLAFALKRMRFAKGHYSFRMPYEDEPAFKKIIINPVTFCSLQAKVDAKEYRCAEEFVNDTKWMLHNANVLDFRSGNPKTISATKTILKICRQEANEIETCAECYLNANTRTDWFLDVCSHPHLLLWAKLKGFPYWPAKAMGFGPHSLVNVKFFGEHDRAFVPVKDCYLYSIQDPNTQTGKRAARELADCVKEVGEHIEKIKAKVGAFNYAPYKTPYEPNDEMHQLENMMPGVQEFIKRHQGIISSKPSLQFKIYKTGDNNMSIIQKDLSTGEISSGQSQQENDDFNIGSSGSGSQKKKPKSLSPPPQSVAEEKNSDTVQCPVSRPPPKYEVILKLSSDDSNSSKLSPVILKRKSTLNGDAKRLFEEEGQAQGHEMNGLPKLAKTEAKLPELNTNNLPLKRRLDSIGLEKPKSKHAKTQEQMKVPSVSIKTLTANKDDNAAPPKDASKNSTEITTSYVSLQTQLQSQADKIKESQKAVESLVKNKQGVTIKKIAVAIKSSAPLTSSSSSLLPATSSTSYVTSIVTPYATTTTTQSQEEASSPSPKKSKVDVIEKPTEKNLDEKQSKDDSNFATEKNDEQKKRDVVNNILKGLKPFIEVKKEVNSDNEQDERSEQPKKNEVANNNITENVVKVRDKENPVSKTNVETQAAVSNSKEKDMPKKNVDKDTIIVDNNIKEEVLSDEEIHGILIPDLSKINTAQSTKVVSSNKNTSDIRLVGETVIQKISLRNSSTNPLANTSSNYTNKRGTLKGIPYGPLPASAFPQNPIVPNDITTISPMAAIKSIPLGTTSPPKEKIKTVSLITTSNVPSLIGTNSVATNHNIDTNHNKSSLSRTTTMVAIPVDYGGSTNQIANTMASIISSIPVPPLTAVSKIPSSENVYSSMTSNNTATLTVSGLSGGSLTTPTVVAMNSTATTTATTAATVSISTTVPSTTSLSFSSSSFTIAARKSPLTTTALTTTTCLSTTTVAVVARMSPITTVTVNSKPTTSTSTSTSTVATFLSSQIPKQTITMTTPPPLAGLSGTVINNPILPPISMTTTTMDSVFTPVTLPTSTNPIGGGSQTVDPNCGNDTQLLTGSVMPTLATAIGDIINRGLPKLASRPRGPLQSEGHPMYNSQAGPVSKVFMDNAHKITDYFISVMEDTMSEIAQGNESGLQARVVLLEKELERTKQSYDQQMAEVKKTSDLMRISMENEKTRLINEIRKQCEAERLRSVDDTKRKQWCAHCRREANFYCCWNTSYCGYTCQQLHWGKHAMNCAQQRTTTAESSNPPNAGVSSTTTHERYQNKSNNPSPSPHLNSSATYNSKSASTSCLSTTTHPKKEKAIMPKNISSNNMMSSSLATTSTSSLSATRSNNSQSAELLKLPTNTYLRPVSSAPLNAQTLRCNTTYSIPVQRFNVPHPITTHANSSNGPPLAFTILRQGNSWAGPAHMTPSNVPNSTIAAPIVNVPPQGPTVHRSGGNNMSATHKIAKTQIRYH